MRPIILFLLGMGLGSVLTYYGIILYAKYMEQDKKILAIQKAKAKWGKK